MTTSWYLRGEAAIDALANVEQGDRELMFASLASSRGISPQTLRREAATARFLGSLTKTHRELGNQLQAAPMAAVEHLMRWYRHDGVGAIEAAEKLAAGAHSVRSLQHAERAARDQGQGGGERGRSREAAYRDRLSKSLRAIGGAIEPFRTSYKIDEVPFDFTWRTRRVDVVVLIVGPYSDPTRYSSRRIDWCLRACWLARIAGRVLMVLPDAGFEAHYRGFLSAHGARVDCIVSLSGEISGADLEEATGYLAR